MTRENSIIELGQWLMTPAGQYLLRWEQDRLDHAVADIFGFHALQVGLPEIDSLRANRMPHRWVATDELVVPDVLPVPEPSDALISTQALALSSIFHCDPEALPFPEQSLDLVVMPHTLERAVDPHLALAEVARVLRPEGRVVIVGLNPTSAWALRQRLGRMRLGMGLKRSPLFLPPEGEFIGYWRARDWLRLLGFEMEHGQFGCWRLPVQSPTGLERLAWMDRVGEHWWPVLGASYILVAVKKVRGMRMVGLTRQALKARRGAAPAVAGRKALRDGTPHD